MQINQGESLKNSASNLSSNNKQSSGNIIINIQTLTHE